MGYSFSKKVLRVLLLVLLSQVGLSHQDAIQDLKEVILGRLDTIDNKLISMEAEIKQISELKDHVDNMDRNMFNAPVNDIKQQEINLLDQINLMKEEGGSSFQLLSNIINLLHGPIDNINNQIFVLDKTLKTSLMMMATSGEAEDPLTFLERPRDQVVINNHIASFTCRASGNLEPRIQWRKNTKPISGNSRYIVVDFPGGSILRIEPVKYQHDEANYECVAENPAGDIISAKARLTVLTDDPNSLPVGFPYFRSEPKTKAVEIDHTALLVCDARGNPDPTIIWYKDNQPVDINNPRYTVLRSGSLQISTSTEEDGGRYECVAENSAGTAFSKLVSLYVRVRRVPPLFSIAPDPAYEVMPGENLNISCVAVGSPMPYVKWKKMTPSVSGLVKGPAVDMTDNLITKNVLVLVDIQESANYTCQAQSTLGLVTQDVQVKVQGCPEGFFKSKGSRKCFKAFREIQRSWTESKTKCIEEGLIMARASDQAAISLRKDILDLYGEGRNFLDGKADGTTFRWQLDGSEINTRSPFWHPGRPGTSVTNNHCLSIQVYQDDINSYPNQPYIDSPCTSKFYTLCQEE